MGSEDLSARAAAALASIIPNSSSLLLPSPPAAPGHLAAHLAAGPLSERVEDAGEKTLLLCDILGDSGLDAPYGLGYRGSATRIGGGGDGSRFSSLSSLICCRISSFCFCCLLGRL